MGRKGQSITLSVSGSDRAELERLALEFEMMWGDRPNISKLVEAIARRRLIIAPNHDWSEQRLTSLEQARNALIDTGQIEAAQAIAKLLLERSELSVPQRTSIQQFFDNPVPPWRLELDRYIRNRRSFQLSYQDAMGRLWSFTVRYAEIAFHERRQYLDCWCEETEGNFDIPELQHNWSLRLDRIAEAGIIPVNCKWRSHLDFVSVEMHLFGRLAFAYDPKPEDRTNEWLEPQVKRVMRRMSNTFWFKREILPYGKDCLVMAPESVRQRMADESKHLYQAYHG
jgi:predicted DNA-binding transcriptional regulator YafY